MLLNLYLYPNKYIKRITQDKVKLQSVGVSHRLLVERIGPLLAVGTPLIILEYLKFLKWRFYSQLICDKAATHSISVIQTISLINLVRPVYLFVLFVIGDFSFGPNGYHPCIQQLFYQVPFLLLMF